MRLNLPDDPARAIYVLEQRIAELEQLLRDAENALYEASMGEDL